MIEVGVVRGVDVHDDTKGARDGCGAGECSIRVEACGGAVRDDRCSDETVLYAARGATFTLRVAGEVFPLGPRDVCLLAPGTEHDVAWGVGTPPLRIALKRRILQGHFLPVACGCPLLLEFLVQGMGNGTTMPYLLFSHRHQGDISADLSRLERESRECEPGYESVMACTLVSMMITQARSWWLQAQVCDFTSRERLAAILDYMSDHAAEATLEGTAAHFNYHPNTVSGLLRRELKRNFSEIIRDYRMERAGSLLTTTDMAVEQVAFLCGYEHLGNFYRVFKAHFGVTPGVYGRGGGEGACVAQKPMSLPCAPNFRDLGGKVTASGAFVRTGLLYRSGGLCEVPPSGAGSLHEAGIRVVYDLRQGGECRSEEALRLAAVVTERVVPDDAVLWMPATGLRTGRIDECGAPGEHMMRNYRAAALRYCDPFSRVLRAIAEGRLPLLFCCRNGRDRAGILTAVILKLLEVPEDSILEDYLRSNAELRERNEVDYRRMSRDAGIAESEVLRSFFEAREEYLESFWLGVTESFGSFERYVSRGLQVDPATRELIHAQLLE